MACDFFGGLFDFNGDGNVDMGEEFLAFLMLNEMTKGENDRNDEFNPFEEGI